MPRPIVRLVGLELGLLAVLGLVLVGGATVATRGLPHDCGFHQISQFAGSASAFKKLRHDDLGCRDLTLDDAHEALRFDFGYALAYGAALGLLTRRWWRSWRNKRMRSLSAAIWLVGPLAALFDVVENVLTWTGLHQSADGVVYQGEVIPRLVSSAASVKWLLFLLALAAVIASLWATIAPRAEGLPGPDSAARIGETDDCVEDPWQLGVCCSGGGIRAAAYALGALQALEKTNVLDDARWLAAVSGGAYASTGWTLLRNEGCEGAANVVIDHLMDPNAEQFRYLNSGAGGLTRQVFKAFGIIAFNVLMIGLFVVAVSWPLGRLMSTLAIQPKFRHPPLPSPSEYHIAFHHWVPGVAIIALGLLVMCVRAFAGASNGTHAFTKAGGTIIGLGTLHLAAFLALPFSMVLIDSLLRPGGYRNLTVLAGILTAGLLGSLVRALTARLTKIASRLGGVALGIGLFLFGGWIANRSAAHDTVPAWMQRGWVTATVVFIASFLFLPIQWASLRSIYRDGLRRAFAWGKVSDSFKRRHSVKWWHLNEPSPGTKGNVPELIVCAASQQMGLAPGGIPATSFTISRSGVRAYARDPVVADTELEYSQNITGYRIDTKTYVSTIPKPFQNELATISGWTSLTGAAFSSAMGRNGYGSTNALMAAFNIDLGAWIPNPWLVHEGATSFKRIRLGYLVKEILGVYDRADENIFVSDGGQWENLGLVELLRRRCKSIICIDASGDTPGSFTTLAQALRLAAADLAGRIEFPHQLDDLRGQDGELPNTAVACWKFAYVDNAGTSTEAQLLYAKLQVAADQPGAIIEYASRDNKFPNYSTFNQFLSREQMNHLIAAGNAAGQQLATCYADNNSTGSPPAATVSSALSEGLVMLLDMDREDARKFVEGLTKGESATEERT